jgi:hypothetical protein
MRQRLFGLWMVLLYTEGHEGHKEMGDQLGGTGQILPWHVFWTCHAGSRRSASLPRPRSGRAM